MSEIVVITKTIFIIIVVIIMTINYNSSHNYGYDNLKIWHALGGDLACINQQE